MYISGMLNIIIKQPNVCSEFSSTKKQQQYNSYLMSNGTKVYQVSHNDTNHNLTIGQQCDHAKFGQLYPNSIASCIFAKYEENIHLLRMQVFHLFGWLWGWQFLVAFSECCLAGAFASYYWAFNKPKVILCLLLNLKP